MPPLLLLLLRYAAMDRPCWKPVAILATVVVMLFALYDALLVFREERSKDR